MLKQSGNIRARHSYRLPSTPSVTKLPFSQICFTSQYVVGKEADSRSVLVCREDGTIVSSNFKILQVESDQLFGPGPNDALVARTNFQEATWVELHNLQITKVRTGVPNILVFAKYMEDKFVCRMQVGKRTNPERHLACLNSDNLDVLWQHGLTYKGSSWFSVTEECVFLLTKESDLTKYSLTSGEVLWVKSRDEIMREVFPGEEVSFECVDEPIVYKNTVVFFLRSSTGCMVGVSAEDGSMRWVTPIYLVSHYSGSPDGKVHVIGASNERKLYRLDIETGAVEKEQAITGDAAELVRAGSGYTIYKQDVTTTHLIVAWVSMGTSAVTAINLETGHMDWSLLDIEHGISELVVRNNRLYFSTISASFPKAKYATYVIEGEGGYTPD